MVGPISTYRNWIKDVTVERDGAITYQGKKIRLYLETLDGQRYPLRDAKIARLHVDALKKILKNKEDLTSLDIMERVSSDVGLSSLMSENIFNQILGIGTDRELSVSNVEIDVPVVKNSEEAQKKCIQEAAVAMLDSRLHLLIDKTMIAWSMATKNYLSSSLSFPHDFVALNAIWQQRGAEIAKIPFEIIDLSKYQKTIDTLNKKREAFSQLDVSSYEFKDIYEEVAALVIELDAFEAKLLGKIEYKTAEAIRVLAKEMRAGLKKEIAHTKDKDLKERGQEVIKKLRFGIDHFKDIRADAVRSTIIYQLRTKVPEIDNWWTILETKLPYHEGDYCRKVPAQLLHEEADSLLPNNLDWKMASSSQRVSDHPMAINLWKVTYRIGDRILKFFRSGVCTLESRAKQLFHAEAAEYFENHPEILQKYLNTPADKRKALVVPHTTIGLLSSKNDELSMWNEERKIFDKLEKETLTFPLYIDGRIVDVDVKMEIAIYNFDVQPQRQLYARLSSREKKANLKAFAITEERYNAYIARLNRSIYAEKDLVKKQFLKERKAECQFLMDQIQKSFSSHLHMDAYVLPIRILTLESIISGAPHIHCKSGKDRTGLSDVEIGTCFMGLTSRQQQRNEIMQKEQSLSWVKEKLAEYDLDKTTAPALHIRYEDATTKNMRTFLAILGNNGTVAFMNVFRTGVKTVMDWWRFENWIRLGGLSLLLGRIRKAIGGNSSDKSVRS